VQDDQSQALYVVEHILAAREQGTSLRQQAVLVRSSHHSDALELELVRRNIPYVKYGGLKFLEAAHVKDVLALLRWADNPRHRIAGFRALQLLPGVGPATADRCLNVFEASGYVWPTLARYQMPPAAADEWRSLAHLLSELAASREWIGQLGRVRQWYEPQLDRIYDAAQVRAGDIEQLERLAGQFANRERFITELTLDPPQATSDLAGQAVNDEDYLVLSTVHSAKGMEWDNVYILNVVDGSFPNEFANKAELVEEERRLLYVAMTRARNELTCVVPLRFQITSQPKTSDGHVYGGRSRFLTEKLVKCFDEQTFQGTSVDVKIEETTADSGTIDVASRLKQMW
jgi:DNA helicase-2/ATP-dependent DNA helicase PcrA